MESELIGKTLNRYLITSSLEETGVDRVVLGMDNVSRREVLIRVMPELLTQRPDFEGQFYVAARAATRLDHPSLAKVLDYGKYQSWLYLVMERVAGETLAQKLASAKTKHEFLPQPEIVQTVVELARALDYAGTQGIEHIDAQPSRISLKPEGSGFRAVICDLGLAWLASGEATLPESKLLIAPAFLSPEQARGLPQDSRSDIYRIAILLYELATVKLPFAVSSVEEVVAYYRDEQLPPPHLIRPGIWANLEEVIVTALQKEPAKRFPDMASFGQALEKVAAHPIVESARPAPASPRPEKKEASQPLVDTLVVEVQNSTAYSIPIKQGEMSIGRGKEADIPLNSLGVSRLHAKLIFDGRDYYLTDLESTNGTFLDEGKLLPGVREPWVPSKVARIGPFTLRLLRGSRSAAQLRDDQSISQIYLRDGSLAERKHVHVSSGEGRVGVVLEQDDLEVAPGESVGMTIILRNQGETVDHFRVAIKGIPANWVTIQPQTVNLMPDVQGTVQATFSPVKAPTSKAGDYDLTIQVSSSESPGQNVEVIANLTVLPFTDFDSELHPTRVDTNQNARVTIVNQGNRPESFLLTLKDNADKLVFTPNQVKVDVAEGQRGAVEFSANTRTWQLFRRSVTHAYTAELSAASGGEKKTYSGEIVSNGLIPIWLPQVLLFVCIGLAVIASVGVGLFIKSRQPTPTPSAAAVETQAPPFSVVPGSTVELTPSPAVTVSPAVSLTPVKICGIKSQNFKKGNKVVVLADVGLNVYSDPNNTDRIGVIPFNSVLVILSDTPVCVTIKTTGAEALRWNVSYGADLSQKGWVTEAEGASYLITLLK